MTEHTSEDAGEGGVVISTTTDCECVARETPSSVATPSSQHKSTTSVTLPPRVLNEEHVSDVKKHNAQDTTLTETETLTTKANKENEYAKKPSTESEDTFNMNTASEKTRMNGNLSKFNTKFSDDACTTVPHTDIELETKMNACECTDDNPLMNGNREQSMVTNNNICSEYDFKSVTPDVSAEQISNTNSLRSRVSSEKSSVASDESKHNDTINVIDYFYRSSNETFKPKIRWPDLIAQLFVHGGCIYGLILMLTSAKILTTLWAFLTIYTSGFGITAGAHRLWSHRAYKARWPLRLLLIFLFTITGQRDVYTWALDHRVHHKYSETDADPHNAKRGFFFAHVGWLFLTPHPDVVVKRAAVDMSDLEADPIVMWQKRLYIPLFALLVIGLPVFVPVYFWDETLWNSFVVNFNCRFCITLNIAFFVNSVAHMWGNRPYDRYISPVENLAVAIAALGEGWHNYHHVFPWDYKTSELGSYTFNPSTAFIDFFAKLGWAYDRKIVSPSMVARRAARSGDGTHVNVWGYGDADIEKHDLAELENMTDKVK